MRRALARLTFLAHLKCFTLSTQEIPPACQGTFTCAIKKSPNNDAMTEVNYTDILCGNSTSDVDVNQDAHRINLRVLEDETLLAEDNVYVPATGESEC